MSDDAHDPLGASRESTPVKAPPPAGGERMVLQASERRLRANQSHTLSRIVSGERLRRLVDHRLDLLRLWLDSFPHGLYQPVDLPARSAKRATGTRSRWEQIRRVVKRCAPATAMDLGANAGFFSIQLGRLGVRTLAVDAERATLRMASMAIRRSGQDNVALMQLELTPGAAELLPHVDASLFLSVWHHLVRHQGIDDATAITERIWERTAKVMFFDSGEDEMDASFGLPALEPTAEAWYADYLSRVCAGSRVEHLGRHDAFDGAGNPCRRNLFAVIREQVATTSTAMR